MNMTTQDILLGGKLTLIQLNTGHRAGTDAVLLAMACPEVKNGWIVDLGCGSGAVGLIAAHRFQHANVLLLDNDESQIECARLGIEANGFSDRVEVCHADILAPSLTSKFAQSPSTLSENMADVVLSNPPYFEEGQGRTSPDDKRSHAHHMVKGGLNLWVKRACALLKPKGQLVMIHRADALPFLLDAIGKRLGNIRVKPIHAHAQQPASRIILSGIKGSKAPFVFLPSLILHEENGSFTLEARALHEGNAGLTMW
jgi:tRNA1(Val) A37 N6-methylase TrmN6